MQDALKSINTEEKVITLAGPPNSGKTTLFNYLTGLKIKSVNYPGSTVECHEAKLLPGFETDITIIDSPGIVSIIPGSPEEKIAVDFLLNHPKYQQPDYVIVTIDSSQITRHLLLAKQLKNVGLKIVVALTMNDVLESKGFYVDKKILSELSGFKVFKIDPRTGIGVEKIVKYIRKKLEKKNNHKHKTLRTINYSTQELMDIFKDLEDICFQSLKQKNENHINEKIEKINSNLKIINNRNISLPPDKRTIKIDKIVLHKYWGIFIFIGIMGLFFTIVFWASIPLMKLLDNLFNYLGNFANANIGNGILKDFITDGIINGAGAVMTFAPQIIILFLLLGFLEDSGYLARGATIIDKPLSKIGLNGRSFVPMISGFACAIPAIMATRTIQNKKERFLTILIIPLISCSARLPVYSLLLSFIFIGKPLVSGIILTLIYTGSIVISLTFAALINKLKPNLFNVKDSSLFIMELPAYRIPKLSIIFRNTVHNLNQYIKKAGPYILIFSILFWFITYFPDINTSVQISQQTPEEIQYIKSERFTNSFAGKAGPFIDYIMKPIGMDWRIGLSLLSSTAAREVFVSSMALSFKVTSDIDNDQNTLLTAMKNAKNSDGKILFTPSVIAGLIIFFMFALQCISTLTIIRKETGNWKIPLFIAGVYTLISYILTFLIVNGLRIFGVE